VSGKAWHLSQASCYLDNIALEGLRNFYNRIALEGLWKLYDILDIVQLYRKLCLAYAAVAELHCA